MEAEILWESSLKNKKTTIRRFMGHFLWAVFAVVKARFHRQLIL
jgi:hypothetical protein